MTNWRKFLRDRWRYFDAALALAVIIGSLVYIYDLLVGSRGLDVAYITRNYPLYLHAVFTNVYATTIAFVVGMALGFSVDGFGPPEPCPSLGLRLPCASRSER